ncbi:MAG: hypothetical protein HKUEN07_36200 [Rhodocyclaceae bacterium]|nr:MAG: hypothetical protein HKUEN07_36200 [Rhodocyclaceae bacterium]
MGGTAAAQPQGAPEQYADFTAPEGAQLDAQVLEAFKPLARELGLAQEGAQKVLDTMAPVLARRQAEQLASASAQWADASRADKEFGGDQLDENLAVAKKAIDVLASPELRQLLSESGLGNHPEVIRMFLRAGKSLGGEDRFVAGQADKTNPGDARRLYGASNMNP